MRGVAERHSSALSHVSDSIARRHSRSARRCVALATFLTLIALGAGERIAQAANCTWGGSTNGTWGQSNRWTNCGGNAPQSGDTVTISSGSVAAITTTIASVTVSGTGTLTVAAGVTLTVTGAFSETGGTFTMSGGDVSVGGAFTRSGGTFTATGGTVTLTGSGNLSNTSNFSSLTVSASGTYTLMSALTAGGTLTVTAGTLTVGTNNLTAGAITVSGGALTVTTNTTQVNGTVTLNGGTFTATSTTTTVTGSFTRAGGTLAANGGTVALTGTGTITSATGSFANLSVSGTYSLADALTTSGTLTLSAGSLTAGANAISVGGTFSQSGGAFTAPSGTMTVTGAFTRTGGTFTANGGTLTLNSTGTVSHTFGGATLNRVTIGQDGGLVGYWRLDESSGAAIVDSSGYGNGGNLVGGFSRTTPPSAITFSDANAVTFDGTAYSTLGITGIPKNDEAQTISVWVNLTSNSGVQNFVALINGGSGSAVQLGIRNDSCSCLVAWSYGGGTLASAPLPSTGVWHHVAYTFDGTTHRVYVDGVAGTSTTNAPQTATPTQTYLGSYDGVNEFLYGALDDVRVYNRTLTAAQITTLAGGSNLSPGVGGTHTFADAFVASDDLVIGTGTVTGTQTLSVGGSWLNNGGTFTGTGAVTLTGTIAGNVVVSNGSQFSSLTVSGSGGTYAVVDPLVDAGALTIAAGATVSGSGTIRVGGNWANSGTFSGTGTVTLTGSGARTLKSNGSRFAALTMSGTGTYTLQDRLWVPGGTVTLTSGTIAAGANAVRAGGFSVGSGTFTNSGTLILDSASNQSLPFSSYAGALRLEDTTETSLVAYWKLDAGLGYQVYDFSGNGNNGTLSSSGTAWQTSVGTTFGFENPASVVFDGATGTATIPAATLPKNNAAQTISFWMNPTTMGGTQNMVALDNLTAGGGLQLGIRSGTIYVWAYGGATLIQGPAVTTGAWHHVVYTYDGAGNQALTIDGVRTTATATNPTTTPSYAYLGTYSPNNELYGGALDEVRVYNTVLTTAQIAQLYAGRYAGTGGIATYTLGANTTVTGQLFVDDVILDASTRTMAASYAAAAAQINTGTYLVGSNTQTFAGGLTVSGGGTLSLASSGGVVAIGNGKTLTVDGTVSAASSGATIRVDSSGTYSFKVGSSATARPTLNITGLTVRNTDDNGMWINTVSGSSTTFTHFDGIAFNNGGTGAASQYLQVSASSLYLTANALSFGAGETGTLPTVAVKLTGNGTADTFDTRMVLAAATCATAKTDATTTLCVTSWKSDDDADGDGAGNTAGPNGGAVVQFARSAPNDTAGSIEGFPVAAFDWNTFAYYGTYVTFHDASGTVDRVYVRSQTGAARYSWDTASGETIVGVPRAVTSGSAHYLYVATNGSTTDSGRIYRLLDNGSSLTPDTSGNWSGRNPFTSCSCTITTPLGSDATNLYWGGTTGGAQRLWRLAQALAATTPFGLSNVSITPTITSATPAQMTVGTTVYMLLGLTGHVLKVDVTNMLVAADNTSPGTASVYGRIGASSPKVFAGDDGGTMWALDINNFAGTNKLWSYAVSGDSIKSTAFHDSTNTVLTFGTEGGKVVALNSGTGAIVAGYPMTPGATDDPIRSAMLYTSGVLAVGTTKGKLYFIDRSAATLIRKYDFGATESVSGVGYDSGVSRYIVTTGDAAASDGRLYYIDRITDPTAASP
jgi:hypothetical protein